MNNKLTRQQVLEYIRDYLDAGTAGDVIASLDDTCDGFSNRETREAAQYLKSNLLPNEKQDASSLRTYTETVYRHYLQGESYDYHLRMLLQINSFWRVNWDEVARALQSEGGEE